MGQFKPMVKMETTEPSVILKLKKGGHVNKKAAAKSEHGHKPMGKMDGGVMGALAGTPALVGRPALNAPVASPGRPSMAARRKAMAGRMMNTPVMKEGGKADMAQDKAMIKKAMKQHDAQEHKGGKGTQLKLKKGGSTGAAIPSESTRGKYATTEVHEAKPDHSKADTGDVKLGNAGGYKKGGKVMKKSTGGAIPSETTRGKYATTEVHEAKADRSGGGTGGVRMGNGGGFKKGGKVQKKADGGVMRYVDDNVVGTPPGKTNTKTGSVTKSTKPGEYKKGGAAKKPVDGGLQDDGRPVKMPQGHKKPSPPVDITMLSGTFKKGGSVKKKADGGVMEQYAQQKADEASRRAYELQGAREREENESLRNAMSPARLLEKAREMFRGVGAVSDVEREKARTVVPAKKYGGKAC